MTESERRTVFAGVTLVMVAVIALRVVPAAHRAWNERVDRLAQVEGLVAAQERAVRDHQEVTESLGAARRRLSSVRERLVPGADDASAGTAMLTRLTELSEECAVRLRRAEARGDSLQNGTLRRVSALLDVETDTEGLLVLLSALADDSMALGVRSAKVVAPDPVGAPHRPERLDVQLVIDGWYTTEAGR